MFCPKCGNTLPDNATFCNNCGTALNNPAPRYSAPKQFSLSLGAKTTALILKCIALVNVLFVFIYGIVCAASNESYFKLMFGGFGAFLVIFCLGVVLSGILYGVGDLIERK